MGIRKKHSFFPFFLLFFFCSQHRFAHGANTISANQTLSGDQTIVSSGGIFALGFFKPSGSNSSKNYIGIWYNSLPGEHVVVWVANRDKPISDRYSSQLRFMNGNLVLLNESQISIWSTNISSSSSPVEAILGDDGNFELKDVSNSTIWQSFDYPGNTWLPGAKLSYNKRTKTSQTITSWKNSEDPSVGLYSFEPDEISSQYLLRWNGSKQYWTTGPWNGKIFSLVPELRSDFLLNFSYVDNENESYFTYFMYNPKVISRFFMDVTGQIRQVRFVDGFGWNLFWSQPRTPCEVFAFCGGNGVCNQMTPPLCNCLKGFNPKSPVNWYLNDFSGGCVRKMDLQCGSPSGFMLFTNMRLPDNPKSLSNRINRIKDCASLCQKDCSCTAYSYDILNGCWIWDAELLNLQTLNQKEGGSSIYIRLTAKELAAFARGKRSSTIIGAIVGSVGFIAICIVFYTVMKKRRKKRSLGMSRVVEGSLVEYIYHDLQIATKNFSEKLGVVGGRTGFGSVFKGMLSDSTLVAVKKLDGICKGKKQFRTEVCTIGTIQHVNLVHLHGFCSKGNKKFLVYEYMKNGSLDSVLFNQSNSKALDWKTRYKLATGIARGLAYLHDKCRDCIIHCNIKPENILLDSNFSPKVADFGLAKLIGRDFLQLLTTIEGTRGYLAPECISGLPITAKADVYSYGMLLFELISGRRNSDSCGDGTVKFFPTLAANLVVEGGDILNILDDRLHIERADTEEVTRICRVACWCIQDEEGHRPTMSQVVMILEGVVDVNRPPIPTSLQVIDIVNNPEHI